MKLTNLQTEKELEMAAIWGAAGCNNYRYPTRRQHKLKEKQLNASANSRAASYNEDNDYVDNDDNDGLIGDVNDDFVSNHKSNEERNHEESVARVNDAAFSKESKKMLKSRKKASLDAYRLHCFVEAGTTINDLRTLLEPYDPKVELRTSQKGSLLNKTHYAVLTFRNKATALHAVQMLDNTDQRDTLGVRRLKFNLMLNRTQSKIVRQRLKKKRDRCVSKAITSDANDEKAFIEQFIQEHLPKKNTKHEKGNAKSVKLEQNRRLLK